VNSKSIASACARPMCLYFAQCKRHATRLRYPVQPPAPSSTCSRPSRAAAPFLEGAAWPGWSDTPAVAAVHVYTLCLCRHFTQVCWQLRKTLQLPALGCCRARQLPPPALISVAGVSSLAAAGSAAAAAAASPGTLTGCIGTGAVLGADSRSPE